MSTPSALRQRRSIVGAFVGSTIEWYDFFIFGTAAALAFGPVFYPEQTPVAGLIASLATFWVGFLARPLGGLIFSHFGDRIGRKNVLVFTLVTMGTVTVLIGLLPGYATIGVWAPILLVILRALQGIAVGGEWGGAVLMATENARPGRKGFAGAWVQQGFPAAAILGTLAFMVVGSLPNEQFLSWGWRVPFLLSAVLVAVGLLIRLKVEESVEFEKARAAQTLVRTPIVEVFRIARKTIFVGVLASVMGISLAYFTNTFLLSWATTSLGIERSTMLNILLGMSIIQFIWVPFSALIAERVGHTKMMILGLALCLFMVIPFFMAIGSANPVWIAITLYIVIIGGGTYYAQLANALAAAFPPHIRYTGVSLSYQLCSMLIGGATPVAAVWILNSSGGNVWAVAAFFAVQLIVTIVGVGVLATTGARGIARYEDERRQLTPAA